MEEAKFLHSTKITHHAHCVWWVVCLFCFALLKSVTLEPRIVKVLLVVAERSMVR